MSSNVLNEVIDKEIQASMASMDSSDSSNNAEMCCTATDL
jgi:hypothetical protein